MKPNLLFGCLIFTGLPFMSASPLWSAQMPSGLLTTSQLGDAVNAVDAVIVSAQNALSQGQATAALLLLQGHQSVAVPGHACLLRAQALLALGRITEARAAIGPHDVDHWKLWPERWRSAGAAVLGESYAIDGQSDLAQTWLAQALAKPNAEVAVDRVLLLYAETLLACGDRLSAERFAHVLWRDWPRSAYRARAGILEARLLAEQHPDQARVLLAGVRSLDGIDPLTYLAAAELLCRLLLDKQPAQCLSVADQAITASSTVGSLPIWRALAMVKLDRQAGIAAIAALSPEQRQTPIIEAVVTQLQTIVNQEQRSGKEQVKARAQLAISLGHEKEAVQLLRPIAREDSAALVLLASIPREPLDAYVDSPAILQVNASVVVGVAFAQRGELNKAWPLFQRAINQGTIELPTAQLASLWYWGALAAEANAPHQASELRRRLLEMTGTGLEIGLTWCAEAQRREQQDAGTDRIREAWERAAFALPVNHPWHPSASWRAAKPYLEVDQPSTRERALALLLPASAVGDTDDHRRCRFYLAQLYERMGKLQESAQIVDSLRKGASPEQLERLDRLATRLHHATSPEVQSDPLDAEN